MAEICGVNELLKAIQNSWLVRIIYHRLTAFHIMTITKDTGLENFGHNQNPSNEIKDARKSLRVPSTSELCSALKPNYI